MKTAPFQELRTARFVLRRIVQSDAPAVFAGLSDPLVIAHYGVSYESLAATQRQMEWYETLLSEGSGIWWGICTPDAPSLLLGACGLNDLVREHRRAELGYWLMPEFWGAGIARECVARVLDHAFGPMDLHRVGAEVDDENHRSWKLLEALRFQYEGTRRAYEVKAGTPLDVRWYSRLSSDAA